MNIDKITEKIMRDFFSYIDGVRILMLIHRKKEGGQNCDRKHIKKLSTNKDEFEKILKEYLTIIKDNPKIPYRIYSSVNERDMKKSIAEFNKRQIDINLQTEKEMTQFYDDIRNRFFSCVMSPSSRVKDGRSFIIDCDSEEEFAKAKRTLANITKNYIFYPTKNGYHIICQPVDIRMFEGFDIKKDGLILLYF